MPQGLAQFAGTHASESSVPPQVGDEEEAKCAHNLRKSKWLGNLISVGRFGTNVAKGRGGLSCLPLPTGHGAWKELLFGGSVTKCAHIFLSDFPSSFCSPVLRPHGRKKIRTKPRKKLPRKYVSKDPRRSPSVSMKS